MSISHGKQKVGRDESGHQAAESQPRSPIDVECSRCGAQPGERCSTKRGQPHAARRVYARTGRVPLKMWLRDTLRATQEQQP